MGVCLCVGGMGWCVFVFWFVVFRGVCGGRCVCWWMCVLGGVVLVEGCVWVFVFDSCMSWYMCVFVCLCLRSFCVGTCVCSCVCV